MVHENNGRRVAIVTGGGSGIGRGISLDLGADMHLVVADIDVAAAEATSEEINRSGGSSVALAVDVTDEGSATALVDAVLSRWSRLDVLCSNVGIYPEMPLVDMTLAEWQRVLTINLTGGFVMLKACLRPMLEQRDGRVVMTSSITGPRTVVPFMAHYAASKAGLNGLIRAAAVELAPYGITVNGVEPGTVLTEGFKELGPDFAARTARGIPIGRLAEPQDIARAVRFLAAPEGGYITGQTIVVDGGQILPESGMLPS